MLRRKGHQIHDTCVTPMRMKPTACASRATSAHSLPSRVASRITHHVRHCSLRRAAGPPGQHAPQQLPAQRRCARLGGEEVFL